jgi:hypothetical protein
MGDAQNKAIDLETKQPVDEISRFEDIVTFKDQSSGCVIEEPLSTKTSKWIIFFSINLSQK